MASHRDRTGKPAKANRKQYWMCYRCKHRWWAMYKAQDKYYTPIDQYGYALWTPPKDSCPKCGSKFNIRSFTETSPKQEHAADYSLDPFTGEKLPDF